MMTAARCHARLDIGDVMGSGSCWSREDLADDLVAMLTKLTDDMERFDSMVTLQRQLIDERTARQGVLDQDQLAQVNRLSLDTAEIITSARQALAQLRGFTNESGTALSTSRDDAREPAREQLPG